MGKLIAVLLSVLLAAVPALASIQGLDEVISRKARYSTNTYYSGEETTNYTWQPETLAWSDNTTTHEVWSLVYKPNNNDIFSKEHADNAWSASGQKMLFRSTAGLRVSSDTSLGSGYIAWVVNTDGTKIRPVNGAGRRASPSLNASGWAHTTQSTYYAFGSGESGTELDTLYKCSFDANNSASCTALIDTGDVSGSNTYQKEIIKNGVSGTDAWVVARDWTDSAWPDPNTEIDTRGVFFIRLSDNNMTQFWGNGRAIGDWGDSHFNTAENRFHDAWAIGPNAEWIMGDYSGNSDIFAILKRSGTYTDGGPTFEDWDGDSWGTNQEIRVISDGNYTGDNPYSLPYFGHPTVDWWGKYLLLGTYTDPQSSAGTRVLNVLSIIDSNTGAFESNYPLHQSIYDGQHHSWSGWTDYIIGVSPSIGTPNMKMGLYTGASSAAKTIVTLDFPGYSSNYNIYPRPSQSPDGTKVAFASGILVSNYSGGATADDYVAIAYVIAYYPNPPLITQATQSSGTVTVRVGWDLTGTPRGYTTRGWPDESANDPPPPREIEKFRLWRSADKTTWVPVKTFDHSVWTNYNFATGAWTGDAYWETTDAPGAGTWYYAVTSIEYAGLESRNLSNVYTITIGGSAGSEDTVYPATKPYGGLGNASSAFYTSFNGVYNSKLIRYYNIYAKDGSAPSISQTTRIASISKNACSGGACSWVDWLGDTGGTTQYVVTAVDTQGNEGAALTVTATHQKSPATAEGQYTLEWSEPADESEAPVTSPHKGRFTAGAFSGSMY